MKQIGLFLIFLITPLILPKAVAQVPDNLKLFESITDIEMLIKQNQVQAPPPQKVVQTVIQQKDSIKHLTFTVVKVPLDSLYHRKSNGTLILPDNLYNLETLSGLTFKDTIFYNPLFLPMIFTGKILPPDLSFYPPKKDDTYWGLLIPQEKTFAPNLLRNEFVYKTRRNFYRKYPDRVKLSIFHFDSLPTTSNDKEVMENFNPFKELISTETSYSLDAPHIEGVEIKRRYWVYNGEHSFQLSQSYFSPNWHKGGTSNININNTHALRMNYRKNKVRFNNTFEWRLSVFTAPDDTVRKYRIGDDLIRYYGDFGIDAFHKRWSYSTNLDVRSQLFNNYPTNSKELRSAFTAPLYVNGGIGLKYNLDKRSQKIRGRRTRFDLHLAPISFNFRYIGNENVNVKRYGIEEGKNSKMDLGSTITANLIYDYNRYITWNSRLKYFTSYNKVEAELENTLNMALTNAFSTRFFLNLRYDDSVPPDPKYNYLQVTQLLSFGFNYKW
ncbi:MAG: hypothetical protein BWZ00_00155 [Bacteroidetes bacterium ADurb.BinA174]|nr:MAG: hypothetical protein BWZ00_00155 [Bacteroidetes bacterium ADurb.BinA174]